MVDLSPWPDIETAIMDLVVDLGTAGTETPADLASHLPYIRVMRLGGTDNRLTDDAHMSIDVFESTRPLVMALAEAVRQRLLSYPHVVNGVVIDIATTLTAPQVIPWGDPKVRHSVASYTVSARR